MNINIDDFLINYFKEDETITVPANWLQGILREQQKTKNDEVSKLDRIKNLEMSVKILQERIKNLELALAIHKQRNQLRLVV